MVARGTGAAGNLLADQLVVADLGSASSCQVISASRRRCFARSRYLDTLSMS
jgi:hypothetical protein